MASRCVSTINPLTVPVVVCASATDSNNEIDADARTAQIVTRRTVGYMLVSLWQGNLRRTVTAG
jgi:hypothetical protein